MLKAGCDRGKSPVAGCGAVPVRKN